MKISKEKAFRTAVQKLERISEENSKENSEGREFARRIASKKYSSQVSTGGVVNDDAWREVKEELLAVMKDDEVVDQGVFALLAGMADETLRRAGKIHPLPGSKIIRQRKCWRAKDFRDWWKQYDKKRLTLNQQKWKEQTEKVQEREWKDDQLRQLARLEKERFGEAIALLKQNGILAFVGFTSVDNQTLREAVREGARPIRVTLLDALAEYSWVGPAYEREAWSNVLQSRLNAEVAKIKDQVQRIRERDRQTIELALDGAMPSIVKKRSPSGFR